MDTLYIVQWVGSILGMLGAVLLIPRRNDVKFWGFAVFTLSNITMIAWALATGNHGVAVSQTVYTCTSLLALWTHRPATNPSQPSSH